MLNWVQPFGSALHNIFCYMLYEIIAQPWFRVGMRLRCAGVLLPVGPVPVHCRVGQRSAVLWRQIAVGCWSTNHSDPKQFPGVLQGDNHRVILSQQAEVGRLRVSVAPPGMSQHQGLLPGPPFFFLKFSFVGELVVSPLLTCLPWGSTTHCLGQKCAQEKLRLSCEYGSTLFEDETGAWLDESVGQEWESAWKSKRDTFLQTLWRGQMKKRIQTWGIAH